MTGDNVLVQFRSADKRKAYLSTLLRNMAEARITVEVREPKAPAKVSRFGFMTHTVYRTIGDMVAVNMVLEKAEREKEIEKKGNIRNEEAKEQSDAR